VTELLRLRKQLAQRQEELVGAAPAAADAAAAAPAAAAAAQVFLKVWRCSLPR
jgi:DNA methyltransferase 1-associated protein 1